MTHPHQPDLSLKTMGAGIYHDKLGENLLSLSEREILHPGLLASAMTSQLGRWMNELAVHQFGKDCTFADALAVKERAEPILILATIFYEQACLMEKMLTPTTSAEVIPMETKK